MASSPFTAAQRKRMSEILKQLGELHTELEGIEDDARSRFNDRSEKWHESETAEEHESAIDLLGGLAGCLQDNAEVMADLLGVEL